MSTIDDDTINECQPTTYYMGDGKRGLGLYIMRGGGIDVFTPAEVIMLTIANFLEEYANHNRTIKRGGGGDEAQD